MENSGERLLDESAAGRFDAVERLLANGAPAELLSWTALHHAVATGTLGQVDAALRQGADLEQRDHAQRTALLLAIQTRDLDKLELLLLYGANIHIRGTGGKPALFHALEQPDLRVFEWMLTEGFPLDLDDRGVSLLGHALDHGHFDSVQQYLDGHFANLLDPIDPVTAKGLLIAGADPRELDFELRRALIGLPPEPSIKLYSASAEEYRAAATPRFGRQNPERQNQNFLLAMLRSGIDGYFAGERFDPELGRHRSPIWSAYRHGQSITFLPDGRIIQIGGEHEDGYDPDFWIYNDVFVHYPDGRHEIYGYPEKVFPPTDFHTATRVGRWIWIIGALGYQQQRNDVTPVYMLNTETLKIRRPQISGDSPGWIHRHRALLTSAGTIRVQIDHPRRRVHELDINRCTWRAVEMV